MILKILFALMIGRPPKSDVSAKWKSICEKHLVSNDPYDEARWKYGPWGPRPYGWLPEDEQRDKE